MPDIGIECLMMLESKDICFWFCRFLFDECGKQPPVIPQDTNYLVPPQVSIGLSNLRHQRKYYVKFSKKSFEIAKCSSRLF